MVPDRAGREVSDTALFRLRGRMRGVPVAIAVLTAIALCGPTVPSVVEPDGGWLFTLAGLVVAALLVSLGVHVSRRGIVAFPDGVLVRNLFRNRRVAWANLVDITFDAVVTEAGFTSYHRLLFTTTSGPVVAQVPGGRTTPGGRLDSARTRLLAVRDQMVAEEG